MKVMPQACAIYTRKSSEEGLEQGFNSLDAQREACEAFILSQKAQGWRALVPTYDDGGFSGGNTERPGLKRLLADVTAGRVRIVVVYKVDRLTRSLADFAKLVELFDAHGVSFVSVTQQFNTTSSMGRLTLNVLLSFAQFEREVTGERIRDKIAASKRKGMWMGGSIPAGYVPHERTLQIDEDQAHQIREIYRLYLQFGCVRQMKNAITRQGWVTPIRKSRNENVSGGRPFSRGNLYRILTNPIYVGKIVHKEEVFDGQHPAIVDMELWQAVQDKLKDNLLGNRSRATAQNSSLLAGFLFDGQGNRLTPTHSKKGARRYRYYTNQYKSSTDTGEEKPTLRWPAQELESAVMQAIERFLIDESSLIELMGEIAADDACRNLQAASALANQVREMKPAKRIEVLQRIIRKISVHDSKIEIAMIMTAIWSQKEKSDMDELETLIEVPVELKRCGMAVRLIVRAPGEAAPRVADPKLVARIAKAHDWFARLSSGRCDSIQAIAKEEQVTGGYVARIIHLAFLAPDIVQRIIRGEHSMELNADRLIRMVPLPVDWEDQRLLLGMNN